MSNFEQQLQALSTRALALDSLNTFAQRNAARRLLYCESEMLILSLEEAGEDSTPARALSNSLAIEPSPQAFSIVLPFLALEIPAFCVWMFGFAALLLMAIPLRWLHPALRKLGLHNNLLPIDLLQRFWAKGFLAIFGIRYEAQGEISPVSHITMFQHPSNLDPWLIVASSPEVHKWVGKQSLFMVPLMGWAARFVMGCLPLDRSDRGRAILSLKKLQLYLTVWNRSIAISPEGTREPHGQLTEFKKGPFYLHEDLRVPIVPVVLFGPHELWPRGQRLPTPGHVVVRYEPCWSPLSDMNRDQVRVELRKRMLKALTKDPPLDAGRALTFGERIWHLVVLLLVLAFGVSLAYVLYYIRTTFLREWSTPLLLGVLLAYTVAMQLLTYFSIYFPSVGSFWE
eukprot:NODE_2264_length_1229_cov_16.417423_g2153_i0.p1 GENE.NODE_2264_length_1229_cov_16.417423_g2153_i0~~NODE_2264_length_1229_cov_16.417423_g2153_i0.p1  ORF type:complete len:398 (+),score=61.61 NODE_2264_length_1229_cov_16.417423_g2153_i0:11-1204(+)